MDRNKESFYEKELKVIFGEMKRLLLVENTVKQLENANRLEIQKKTEELDGIELFETREQVDDFKVTVKFPVINYYPWERIRILTALFLEGSKTGICFEYAVAPGGFKYGIEGLNTLDNGILIFSDILIEEYEQAYFVKNCILKISDLNNKGITEPFFLEEAPFDMRKIENIKVLIRKISSINLRSSDYFAFYATSNMTSQELREYRARKMCCAICMEEELQTGWQCKCGMVYPNILSCCQECKILFNSIESDWRI